MADRHFVKYTFLKVDPGLAAAAGRAARAATSASSSPPARTSPTDHLLQAFSLVGTRGDADLMLSTEAENLDRIHEFHVVLAQSGLMKWCDAAVLVPRDAQELGVLRRAAPRRAAVPRQVPVRLPVRQVAASGTRCPRTSAGAIMQEPHRGRQRVPERRQPHDVLLRPRRPGVRRRLRHRRRRARSSTSSSACARPRPRPTPCATRRASRAFATSLERALDALDGEPIPAPRPLAGGVAAQRRRRGRPRPARGPTRRARARLLRRRSDAPPSTRDEPRPRPATTTPRSCARSSASSCRRTAARAI